MATEPARRSIALTGKDAVNGEEIQERLRARLRAAMKARDAVAASALRSVLAAIANAEAVPVPAAADRPPAGDAHVAGTVAGLGAGEAARRALTADDVAAIVAAEAADRRAAADQYEDSGATDRAARLRQEAEVIESAVDLRLAAGSVTTLEDRHDRHDRHRSYRPGRSAT